MLGDVERRVRYRRFDFRHRVFDRVPLSFIPDDPISGTKAEQISDDGVGSQIFIRSRINGAAVVYDVFERFGLGAH